MSNKKLTGKVALVTGGSRVLGAAIAKRLVQDGAAVALTYTSSLQKANEVGACDQSDRLTNYAKRY
ncbi:SDR family NAD(P)-dependent oxidoreductase [uncultured Nostoc sp.]|uniref:SDR family NAD(P)-dependent oxidoreductase n=1 Tax=uncultured Nostoc sp. TaxID=340711 RepID=UPI0025D5F7A4|nr:SDR family NAD(P)-dependent oxidoreductase [Nostoc sp. LPT]